MSILFDFYYSVFKKKSFYLPILFFAIVGYSYSIYNRTVGWDDLLLDNFYAGKGTLFLSSRWGNMVWLKLLGLMELDSFMTRFTSLLLYEIAAVLLCVIFYSLYRSVNTLSYTILSSIFVTYPLVNEIWEYGIVNYTLAGGLCLANLAIIVIRSNLTVYKKYLISSLLLILPVSGYESPVFYYISLVSIVLFSENLIFNSQSLNFVIWFKRNLSYYVPLIVAVILRFVINFFILRVFDLDYSYGGDVGINWLHENIFRVLYLTIGMNFLKYIICSLVYFPIFVFVISLTIFIVFMVYGNEKRSSRILLGIVVIISLFCQALLQGTGLFYRSAQTITLFVAFVSFLVCIYCEHHSKKICYSIYILLFILCWHQAVFLNRTFQLNNLRSDNELAIIHQVGFKLTSEYERKPVVFVAPYQIGKWISKYVEVDETTWNGRLFYAIHDKFIKLNRPYKYINTNVNCATEEYPQIQSLFSYCGYDIDVIQPRPYPCTDDFSEKDRKILNDAIRISSQKKLKPYQIYDMKDYLIVNLGGRLFRSDGFYYGLN